MSFIQADENKVLLNAYEVMLFSYLNGDKGLYRTGLHVQRNCINLLYCWWPT